MTRTLFALFVLAGFAASAHAQTRVTPVYPSPDRSAWSRPDLGTYNYNNPLYHGVYPPTAYYPGGYVSSHAYTNPGSSTPTTYISHYRSMPVVETYVPVVETYVPVVQTYYSEVRGSYYSPPPAYPYYRSRWR
jgi:hypothetical protein